MNRTPDMDAFVEEAKAVDILAAFERAGFSLSQLERSGPSVGAEHYGPCPICGGTDRFAINPRKQKFICRGGAAGGALTMVMHITGVDFVGACELIVGRDRPGYGDLSPAERAEKQREAIIRAEALRAVALVRAEKQRRDENMYRDDELRRCRRDWDAGLPFHGSPAEQYLQARGLPTAAIDPAYLRCHPDLLYSFKPKGKARETMHRGPAMLACFVVPEISQYRMIGLHRTWIDLDQAPKYRPALVNPDNGEALPTKKMRGSKMGGILPLIGRLSGARRMVAGEGIETVLGFAAFDGLRADTFYCAAGDLGNLCGTAVAGCRVRVPDVVKIDRAGRKHKVFAPGEEPDMLSICLPVPETIEELVLLGDGDSEPVMTRAALVRGAARHGRYGRVCRGLMAPRGKDWADVAFEQCREAAE